MKNAFITILSFTIIGCSSQKINNQNDINITPISIENNLTVAEKDIINDFLETELRKERYKRYKNFQYVIIQESLTKRKAIETYAYCYEEYLFINRRKKVEDIENRYFLDTLQVKKILVGLENEEIYPWKVTDFKNIKTSIIKREELIKLTNTGSYINSPNRLIFFLSKPLMIDENKAFLSFDISQVNSHINHFTIFMTKII